ncbi:MAG: hypothetical protein D6704_12305 [Nitrospirae bacterium]|nr:MAG: hypothetical protein D6704_12305 [Nitrospirota bacterium]
MLGQQAIMERKYNGPPTVRAIQWWWAGILLLTLLHLAGCLSTIWDRYQTSSYNAMRANRRCHPYGECRQGQWVQAGKSERDALIAYAECKEAFLKTHGHWADETVTMGLEIQRCMRAKGYELK